MRHSSAWGDGVNPADPRDRAWRESAGYGTARRDAYDPYGNRGGGYDQGGYDGGYDGRGQGGGYDHGGYDRGGYQDRGYGDRYDDRYEDGGRREQPRGREYGGQGGRDGYDGYEDGRGPGRREQREDPAREPRGTGTATGVPPQSRRPGDRTGNGSGQGPGEDGEAAYGGRAAARRAAQGGGGGGRAAARKRRKGGGRGRALRWIAVVTSVAVLGAAGASYAYYEHLNHNIKKRALDLGNVKTAKTKANAAGQTPLNILLIGSDSRASAADQKLGGARNDATRAPLADVEMLMHVSADRSNMTVVSVPRDTRVTIPQCKAENGTVYPETDTQTINTSLGHGGPGCTVATWEKLTGIHIDHFMMVDFAGVVDMADAVGGVPVCVKSNVHDPYSHLKLTAGTHKVKGVQALEWLRTRHGFEDGSDIGRTHAQHMYMSSMVRQLKAGSKLTNPKELLDLAEAATKALTVDPGIGTVKKLMGLAKDIKRVPTSRTTMTTMPWTQDPEDPTAHVVPTSAATELFTMIRNDQALDGKTAKKLAKDAATATSKPTGTLHDKGTVSVAVRNGTGNGDQAAVPGRATDIQQQLATLGWTKAAVDTTSESQSGTTLTYPSAADDADATAVAKALGLPSSVVKKSSSVSGITLTIGADWTTGTTYPKTSKSATKQLREAAAALNANDKTACMKVNPVYSW